VNAGNLLPAAGALVGTLSLYVLIVALFGPSATSILTRLRGLDADDSVPTSAAGEAAAPARSLDRYTRGTPKENIRLALQTLGERSIDRTQRGTALADRLARANLTIKPAEWLVISAGAAALLGFLAWFKFGSFIFGVIGAVAGYMFAQVFLAYMVRKRSRAFESQLGPMVLALSNAVKAGYSISQAFDQAARSLAPPMGPELTRMSRELTLGVPLQEGLGHLVERNELEDLRLLMTAVQIHAQVGGNIASVLDTIEQTIRERVRIKGEIRTLTGQARVSGWILIILPFGLGLILQLIAPSYFGPMLEQTIGRIMLGVASFSMLLGYVIIQKIVNIKV
jgi:tight adherence protein B